MLTWNEVSHVLISFHLNHMAVRNPRNAPLIHVDTDLVVCIACSVAALAILAGGLIMMWLLAAQGIIVPKTKSPTFEGTTVTGLTGGCVIFGTDKGVRSSCDDTAPSTPQTNTVTGTGTGYNPEPPTMAKITSGRNIHIKNPTGGLCICVCGDDGNLLTMHGWECDICHDKHVCRDK